MSIKEKIEVMAAYAEGKKIQFKEKDSSNWRDYTHILAPEWNWSDYDYRIKSEPSYRPYKDADELIEDYLRRNGRPSDGIYMPLVWVKRKADWVRTLVVEFGSTCVWLSFSSVGFTMSKLFHDYTYLDGSPCGVKEE